MNMVYGPETWRMTKADGNRLDTFQIDWPMKVTNEEVR